MIPAITTPRTLSLARGAEAWSALIALYLALSVPLEASLAPILVHWYGTSFLAAVLAWRLKHPSSGTLGAAFLLALYTIVRILMILPRVAEIGRAYVDAARMLSLAIFASVAVAQMLVIVSLWRSGWLRREALQGKT